MRDERQRRIEEGILNPWHRPFPPDVGSILSCLMGPLLGKIKRSVYYAFRNPDASQQFSGLSLVRCSYFDMIGVG
jgi:hypothetical protein